MRGSFNHDRRMPFHFAGKDGEYATVQIYRNILLEATELDEVLQTVVANLRQQRLFARTLANEDQFRCDMAIRKHLPGLD